MSRVRETGSEGVGAERVPGEPGAVVRDRDRWEARYAARSLEPKAAPSWLEAHASLLPRQGWALDVAMGLGGATLALARRGLRVVGLDLAPTAVRQVSRWAREQGLPVEPVVADACTWVWPQERFDVITQFYYLERALFPRMRAALRPGGLAVIETVSAENLAIGGLGPKRREWCLARGELLEHFAGYRILDYREAVLEGPMAVQSIVAQKPRGGGKGERGGASPCSGGR